MRIAAKLVACLAGLLAIMFLAIVIAWHVYGIEAEFLEGSGYGHTIGANKVSTYDAILAQSHAGEAFEILAYNEDEDQKWGRANYHQLDAETLNAIYAKDRWQVFHSEPRSHFDTTKLRFEAGRLVRIRRYRQLMELP